MSTEPVSHIREVKQWENNIPTFDLQKEFVRQNKWTQGFGKDRLTYTVENHHMNAEYWARNEARIAHGYPATGWLQLGFLYAAGLYTAKEQGIVSRGTFFARYWRAHYFDWLTFARRGFLYAGVGGCLTGIVLFGSPDLSFKRAINKFNFYMVEAKPNATETLLMVKDN